MLKNNLNKKSVFVYINISIIEFMNSIKKILNFKISC